MNIVYAQSAFAATTSHIQVRQDGGSCLQYKLQVIAAHAGEGFRGPHPTVSRACETANFMICKPTAVDTPMDALILCIWF